MNSRLNILKSILWAIVGVWAVVSVARFVRGLGATTNLSDGAPWGLWIGFDVMAGVALAAGGFVLAAIVYIFGLERYRPFVRPAILTAFLGYAAVAVGLLYDLGLPWHIWHPLINWQHHSVLFEVAACVMIYLTVLTLEFAPVILEHPLFKHRIFKAIYQFLKKATIPLVIAGIVLSTLHQSSLGSLFLITPGRLHPLWYSPIIYVLFFVSAVGLGLMMVTLESVLSGYFFRHKVDTRRLAGLGGAAAAVLSLYALIRLGDLAWRGVLPEAFSGNWQGNLFLFELGVSAIIPALLLMVPRIRRSIGGLATASALTVLGMIGYRLDTSIVAFLRPEEAAYFPHWMEFAITLGIVAAFGLIFIFFVEHLRVFEHHDEETASTKRYVPIPVEASSVRDFGQRAWRGPAWYSLIAIGTAAMTLVFLPEHIRSGDLHRAESVSGVRTIEGLRLTRASQEGTRFAVPVEEAMAQFAVPGADPVLLMVIDGNRDGNMVLFDHESHRVREGGAGSTDKGCGVCHHMNKPFDRNTSCYECHRDMYNPTMIFDHTSHTAAMGGNEGCVRCHRDPDAVKTADNIRPCYDCHADMVADGSTMIQAPPKDGPLWQAPGYRDAMHGSCIACHEKHMAKDPEYYSAQFIRCDNCHNADYDTELRHLSPYATFSQAEGGE